MIGFIEKLAIKYAVNIVKSRIEAVEAKQPDIAEFRKNLFTMSIPQFMEYGVEKIAKEDLDKYTYIDFVKKLLDKALDPQVDEVVDTVIDKFKPE